jgi:2'-5' RNA ligase
MSDFQRRAGAAQEFGWVRPDNLHLTLRFFGALSESQLGLLTQELENFLKGFDPLELRYQGIGFFPNDRTPEVLWTGVSETENRLTTLIERLELLLVALGFPRELRPYTPHVTLARRTSFSPLVLEACRQTTDFGRDTIRHCVLFESRSDASGRIYEPWRSFAIGAGSP